MRQYYIFDGESKKGPFNLDQLKLQSLNKETPVWYEGLKDWTTVKNVNELDELFAKKIVPPPLPKAFAKNVPSRNELLNSFSEAQEKYPERNRKRFLVPLIISIIIIGIAVFCFMYYNKISL